MPQSTYTPIQPRIVATYTDAQLDAAYDAAVAAVSWDFALTKLLAAR